MKSAQTFENFCEVLKIGDEIVSLYNPKVRETVDQLINSITYSLDIDIEERRMMLMEMTMISDWFKITLAKAINKYRKKNEKWESTDEGSRYNTEVESPEGENNNSPEEKEETKEDIAKSDDESISERYDSKDSVDYFKRITEAIEKKRESIKTEKKNIKYQKKKKGKTSILKPIHKEDGSLEEYYKTEEEITKSSSENSDNEFSIFNHHYREF